MFETTIHAGIRIRWVRMAHHFHAQSELQGSRMALGRPEDVAGEQGAC
jgi:hypothetical protein